MTGELTLASTSAALGVLLEQAHVGHIQVPEFQRPFVLGDAWVRSLLASVSLGYSVGAVMLLEAGSSVVEFESQPLPGTPPSGTAPRWLVVDGQQRLTALYQVLRSGRAVATRGASGEIASRRYYLDIGASVDANVDRDQAVVAVGEDDRGRTSGRAGSAVGADEIEWARGGFPLALVFAPAPERERWQRGFVGAGADAEERALLMARFESRVMQAFKSYSVPTIMLGKDTARWTVRVHGGPDGPALSDRFRSGLHDRPR